MTVSVTPKTVTISNGTANDGSVVNTMMSELYTNDSTLASYINANCALTTGPNSFSDTQTYTATPVMTKGANLAQASEPASPTIGDAWYSSTNNAFEGLVQIGTISGATNASPIVVTTAANHNLGTGTTVYISGVLGNTAANGSWTITVTGATTFSLNTSTGNGAYSSGGTVSTVQTFLATRYIAGVTSRSSNTILAASDVGKLFVCTSTFTQTLTAAATLGPNWFVDIRNDGTGAITLDPNSSETIDGSTTLIMYPGEAFRVVCDGSNFKTVGRQKGGLILLGSATASSSTSVDFTSFISSDFDEYVLLGEYVLPATDGVYAMFRASTNGGSSYMAGTQYSSITLGLGLNGETVSGGAQFALNKTTATIGNADGEGCDFELHFTRPWGGQAMKSARWTINHRNTSGVPDGFSGSGTIGTTSAINAVRFLFSSGNIAQGDFKLYGVRK